MSAFAKTNQNQIDTDCALWVLDALEVLEQQVHADKPVAPGRATADHRIKTLVNHLTAGRINDSVELLFSYYDTDRQGVDPLTALLVPAIHRIEQGWKERTLELGTVILAFGAARHVIDVWRAADARMRPLRLSPRPAVLVAVMPGDQHSFGAQILADDLTMRGFRVRLETQISAERLTGLVAKLNFAAVTLSIGHDGALDGAADLIAQMRAQAQDPGMALLVGGAAFSKPTAQYAFLGADAVLTSAHEAAVYLETLVSAPLSRTRN